MPSSDAQTSGAWRFSPDSPEKSATPPAGGDALARRYWRRDVRTRRERSVVELAAAQHRVIATWQLNCLGLSAAAISERTRVGRLHRIHRAVYAVGVPTLDRHGWWMAGVLATGPAAAAAAAAVSHHSAAGLLGLRPGGGTVHVTVGGDGGRRNRPGLIIHRRRNLHAADITVVDRIPTTTVSRTLLDLAATVRPDHLARALVRAEQLRTLDVAAIHAAIDRAPGHQGAGRLSAALRRHHPDAHRTESELQRRFLVLLAARGIPRPELEVQLTAQDRVDFLWRSHRLVVETDGFAHHGTKAAFQADRARDRRLQALGFTVLRYTYKDVMNTPDETAAGLLSFLTASVPIL